jgi:hypothetical protein
MSHQAAPAPRHDAGSTLIAMQTNLGGTDGVAALDRHPHSALIDTGRIGLYNVMDDSLRNAFRAHDNTLSGTVRPRLPHYAPVARCVAVGGHDDPTHMEDEGVFARNTIRCVVQPAGAFLSRQAACV